MSTVENDAAGGAGSIKNALLGIALNGLSRAVDGRLATKYPLTSFNEPQTINAEGEVKPSSAPQKANSPAAQVGEFLTNPIAIAVAAAVALSVIVIYVAKE